MGDLVEIQKEIFRNKADRDFNVTDVGKEIILVTEELGELARAYRDSNKKPARDIDNRDAIIDAVGDIMVYCIGLCGMMGVECEEVLCKILADNKVRTHRSKL
jgi:NTP pyrophosphatase (non-canonical NTP hydrolase)